MPVRTSRCVGSRRSHSYCRVSVKHSHTSTADAASTIAPFRPCRRAPQCPNNKYGLEEQSHKTRAIRIQAKGVRSRDELRDIARKNHHEEPSDYPTHHRSIALRREDERSAQDKFDHTRARDDRLGCRHPRGHLGQERLSIREMANSSADEEHPQDESTNGSKHAVRMPWLLRLVFAGAHQRRSSKHCHHRPR